MLADKDLRGLLHFFHIERLEILPDVVGQKWRGDRGIENLIVVDFSLGRFLSMKGAGDFLHGGHCDVRGEEGIELVAEAVRNGRYPFRKITMRHLSHRMHTGVGPRRRDHRYFFLKKPMEGFLEDFLNG